MNVLGNKFKPINDHRHHPDLPKRITLLSLMIVELIIGNDYLRNLQYRSKVKLLLFNSRVTAITGDNAAVVKILYARFLPGKQTSASPFCNNSVFSGKFPFISYRSAAVL
jgi:hypothetical protein